jgi:hypothetical protein
MSARASSSLSMVEMGTIDPKVSSCTSGTPRTESHQTIRLHMDRVWRATRPCSPSDARWEAGGAAVPVRLSRHERKRSHATPTM